MDFIRPELNFKAFIFKRTAFLPSSDFEALSGSSFPLFISLLPNGNWLFEWPSTGDTHYRIVLQGIEIDKVVDIPGMQQYVYQGVNYIAYPPPLEIVPASFGLASSEINKPYLSIQWYGLEGVSSYLVQEQVGSDLIEQFRIMEIGAAVYTWTSPVLTDGTSHNYRVTALNSIDQESIPVEFDIDVVTPPEFVDTDFSIDYVGTDIVLDFAE